MKGEVISTQMGVLYSLGAVAIFALMFPGGMWLLTGWGLFHWKSDLIVALLILGLAVTLIWWSLGWANHRYVRWSRPAWIIHPVTRALLAWAFFTCVAAWPFGASQSVLVEFAGIALAPALGGLMALVWLVVFGLKRKSANNSWAR